MYYRLLKSDLKELDKSFGFASCIFQQRIEKKDELHVTVVGKQIFAVKVNLKSELALNEDIHLYI